MYDVYVYNVCLMSVAKLIHNLLCNIFQSSIQLHDVGVNIDHAYNNGGSLRITGTITSSHGKPANVRYSEHMLASSIACVECQLHL